MSMAPLQSNFVETSAKKFGLALLFATSACGAPADNRPARDVVMEPSFIDFDAVSITGQRTVKLSVTAHGDDFDLTNASTSSGKFRFMVPTEVRRGLGDGETGTIEVQYRPCPEAWDGDVLIPNFDLSKCSRRADEGRLRIVDSRYGWAGEVALLGRPAEPGVLEIACSIGPQSCLDPSTPVVAPCERIDFGMVRKGETCQTVVELRNVGGTDSAPVYINELALQLAGREKGEIFSGEEIGITGLPQESFAIAAGETRRVELQFTPNVQGQWKGTQADDLGLMIYMGGREEPPFARLDVTAISSSPRLEIYPAMVKLPRSAPGEQQTVTVNFSNSGNEMLSISEVDIIDSAGALSVSTSTPFRIAPGESKSVDVIYSGSEHVFTSALLVKSSDPNHQQMTVAVEIQPVPKLCVSPAPLLEITEEVGDLEFTNCGDGELEILELQLLRSNASTSYNSLGDFLVEGCPGGHCEPQITLCSSDALGCSVSKSVFHIVYTNQDNSPFDLAELLVRTNDPNEPERIITLKGLSNSNSE